MSFVTIGIEKYDDDFSIPYDENMTLGQFHDMLEKAIGPGQLNMDKSKFEKNKNQKMKDFVKGNTKIFVLNNENLGNMIKYWEGNFKNYQNSCFKDSFVQSLVHSMAETLFKKEGELRRMKDFVKGNTNIFFLKNENLGNMIKYWKGNCKNYQNSCFKDSFVQSLVHSMAETIVKKEEELRRMKGLPVSKSFKDYDNNSTENSFWKELLEVFDIIKNKVDNNDCKPVSNTYDPNNKPKDQNYLTGGDYASIQLTNLSNSSTNTSSSGLRGGNNNIDMKFT